MLERAHCNLPNLEARGAGNRSEPAPRHLTYAIALGEREV
jgi:hypothetical protein